MDKFSPYLDPEPIVDFFDDYGARTTTAVVLAVIVHIGFFFVLQSKFTMPIIPLKQKPIEVQIISFEPEIVQEAEPEPALIPYKPAPARAPKPKPQPKPAPAPELIPEPEPIPEPIPEPKPEPEPIVEPEPVVIPPTTKILVSETIEPTQDVSPQPLPVSEPIPEIIQPPAPQPTIEIFEPIPEPTPEPVKEPVIEPLPEPVVERLSEPETLPEPTLLPEPIAEPLSEPEVEPLPDLPPTPTESEIPFEGAVVQEEIIIETPEPIAPLIQEVIEPITQEPIPLPEPEILPEPEPEPEIIETAPIITTTPTILASPDAPKTQSEQDTAVPQSQTSPLDLILKNAKQSGRPPTGGGNTGQITIGGARPSGGTRRANPGTTGWTLAPGSYGETTTKGYKNMMLDIRCRETTRTHEDCPNYIPQHKGRNAEGYESFNAHEPRGTSTTANERRGSTNMGSSIFEGGTYGGPSAAKNARGVGGNSDDTSGGPSTSVLDDTYLPNFDLSIPVPNGSSSGGRIRDVFGNRPAPWTQQPTLPPPPEEEDEFAPVEIFKPKR